MCFISSTLEHEGLACGSAQQETEETREVTSEECAGVQFVEQKSFNNFIPTHLNLL